MREPGSGRKKAAAKFVVCSFFGIFMFFVRIDIGGMKSIPVDHLIAWMKSWLKDSYLYLILAASVCSIVLRLIKREFRNAADILLFLTTVCGSLVCLAVLLGIGGEAVREAGSFAVDATGNILCAIFAASLFIPFLTEYGLVEAVGILFRPFMRKVFLTPGSSAVIGVSAFLGNYSMGHILARQRYEEGSFTEKESVIIALGFSTCSVGLMINLADYLDLMQYWSAYVACILLITFGVTAIVSRIPPISRKKETYRKGIPPRLEKELRISPGEIWRTGVETAAEAPGFFRALVNILLRTAPVVCGIAGTSMAVITFGMLAAAKTDLYRWIGWLVRPVLMLAGGGMEETAAVSSAIGAGLLEPVLTGILCGGQEISLRLRWTAGIVPYTAIVFFAGFIPSVCSSRIPCTVWEMVILWAERTVLSTVLAVLSGWVLFG